jgi:hypothetical protein
VTLCDVQKQPTLRTESGGRPEGNERDQHRCEPLGGLIGKSMPAVRIVNRRRMLTIATLE